jgi:hemerythrin-like domain-containing protein
MPEILRRLHQDHANGLRLLVLLDRQIELISEGKRPDWDIVQGVIQYFLTYPNLGHHPCEDLILARLRAKNLAAAEPYLGLENEHRQLSDTLQHMAVVTQRLVPVVRANYLDLLRSFVAGQRDHVQLEEAGFLVAAKRLLDARDWQELERVAPEIADPLNDPSDHRFQALRWHIASGNRADGAERRSNEAAPSG